MIPPMEGGDDGEGHPWEVVKDKGAAIFVMYGKGWHATFRLKKDDQKTTPSIAMRDGEGRKVFYTLHTYKNKDFQDLSIETHFP